MQALVFQNQISLLDVPVPVPQADESLIKISIAGICNTDLEITKGYMQYNGILGHEFVGVVKESGCNDLINKRVVAEINLGCGKCEWCARGLARHCPNRDVLGIVNQPGVFAEYVTLPDENLIIVPDNIPDKEAVFVEPLAAALEIIEQIHIEPNHHVAIVGDGKLALLVVQVLRLVGCDLTLFGKHSTKMDIAQQFGARTFDVSNAKPGNEKFDIVVEASGNASGFMFAQQIVKQRGTIVLKSTIADNSQINLAQLVINEITVVGSRCGLFGAALRLLERKLINTGPLLDKVFPFQDAVNAFNYASNSSLKTCLNFN